MKALLGILLLASAAAAEPLTFVNPNGMGGYTILQPGSNQPPTFVNPNGMGGYTVLQPGGQPPAFINPNGMGGYTIIQPGAATTPHWGGYGSDDD